MKRLMLAKSDFGWYCILEELEKDGSTLSNKQLFNKVNNFENAIEKLKSVAEKLGSKKLDNIEQIGNEFYLVI